MRDAHRRRCLRADNANASEPWCAWTQSIRENAKTEPRVEKRWRAGGSCRVLQRVGIRRSCSRCAAISRPVVQRSNFQTFNAFKQVVAFATAGDDHGSADELAVKIVQTRLKMGPSGSSHTNDDIHPYVAHDLRNCNSVVSLRVWIEAVCGIPETRFITWIARIKELDWFADDIIQKSLLTFAASGELKRYTPFVDIANRILALAPGSIPGIPEESPYPIADPHFRDNSATPVQPIPEHGTIGAVRKPDVLCLRRSTVDQLQSKADARVQWTDILHWWEMKYNHLLIEDLSEARIDRGMSALESDGQPVKVSAAASSLPHVSLVFPIFPMFSHGSSPGRENRGQDSRSRTSRRAK